MTNAGRYPSVVVSGASSSSAASRSMPEISYYCNVERPDLTGGDLQLRAQWTFFFPTRRFGVLRGLVVDVCLWHGGDLQAYVPHVSF